MILHNFEEIGKTQILDLCFYGNTIYFIDERNCGMGRIELNKSIEMSIYQNAGKYLQIIF